ncbi:uncharacterized protein LOC125504246 [Dendroctonus ponderosae]|uniref:uncharacterized protein LOC125504246 n=1 Tax=Dendroctonus ponderosae TaxID=77166 RepID=UPI002036473C|nr:uncharacterized protein LOC125504246 [Dendroctonus ponderosae]KAH1018242.1 hypothetical protein HUJ05_006051 [Dendroctonus ponderosae]
MFFDCCLYGALITLLIFRVASKVSEADSFDESFEESPILSPELKRALKPTEDALFSFINRLVNTGYSSSKIALNRVEKASKRRKEFGERLEQFLVELSMYQSGGSEEEEEITEKLCR